MSESRHSEIVAQRVLQAAYPKATINFNTEQSHGECDLTISFPEGRVDYVEVTMSTDPLMRRLKAEIQNEKKGGHFFSAVKSSGDWSIHVTVDANIKKVRKHADDYLARIEEAGLRDFSVHAHWSVPAVRAIFDDLQVEYGNNIKWKRPREIGIGYPATGGQVITDNVHTSIEAEAHKPDNIRKLGACVSGESHLFVYFDPEDFLPWASLVDSMPPASGPRLPEEVKNIWAVTHTRDSAQYVIWRARRGEPWVAPMALTIPLPIGRVHE